MARRTSGTKLNRNTVRSAQSSRPKDVKGVSRVHGEDCSDCQDNVNIISGPTGKNVYDYKEDKPQM